MDLTKIDLNLLVAFEALMTERSVTKAARRLGLSQPATSDTLRRLRLLFRDQLFVRGAGAMQPSPKALKIATGIETALRQLRDTLGREIPFDPVSAPSSFVIAATDYNAHVLLPELLARLRQEAPNVDLNVVGYDKDALGDMLARGEIDLALGVFPAPPGDAVKQTLFAERFVGVARRDHPALREGAPDLRTFAALPQALVTVRQDDRTGAVDRALGEHGLARRVALTVPYMMALPAVLTGSDLICVLPARIAKGLDAQRIAVFELPFSLPNWSVEMLWNPLSRTDRASAWLRQTVQSIGLALSVQEGAGSASI